MHCIQCPSDAPFKAGYNPELNSVWMCSNLFWNPFEYRRILAHELLHAFDFARTELDTRNLDHIACTEIRAHTLSGECDLWTRFFEYAADDWLGNKMFSRKQQCVKNGSVKSMGGKEDAVVAVNKVFQKCYRDHWPFTTQAHMDTRYRDSPMIHK